MTEGNIIIAKTIIAEKSVAPSGRLNAFLTNGTIIIMPASPYTTDGIPESSSTADVRIFETLFPANFEMYIAHKSPIGTPTTIAPRVPNTELSINGRMPYNGVFAVGCQTVPKRKSLIPIFPIAGKPDTARNAVITTRNATDTSPHRRNSVCIDFSVKFCLLMLSALSYNRNRSGFFD